MKAVAVAPQATTTPGVRGLAKPGSALSHSVRSRPAPLAGARGGSRNLEPTSAHCSVPVQALPVRPTTEDDWSRNRITASVMSVSLVRVAADTIGR